VPIAIVQICHFTFPLPPARAGERLPDARAESDYRAKSEVSATTLFSTQMAAPFIKSETI
jgi:hypothetical protein